MIFDVVTLTILSSIAAFLTQFGTLIWRISRAESRIHLQLEDVEHEAEMKIQKVRQEILEYKLEVSNSFMRRDTFKHIMDNIDSRLIRLEGKLDAVIARPA